MMGKNLQAKAAWAAEGMTQRDLADAVGIVQQTMSTIKKGDHNPSINLYITICRALDKTLDQLFWESSEYESQ